MNATSRSPMGAMEWTLLLVLAVLWGGSFFFSKVALLELRPLTVALARVGIAALALQLILPALGLRMPRDGASWRAFIAMGLLNNVVPFTLLFWGQTHIASGLASIMIATTPLFTILVAHFWTHDEKMTVGKMVGVLTGLVGVTIMVGIDALGGLDYAVAGEIAVLGAALSYAIAGVYGRRFRTMGLSPLVTSAGQVSVSAVMILPVVLLVDRPWTLPSWPGAETWGALLGLALLSTVLAYALYFRLLAVAGATNALLATFLIPVSAILLGSTILGERLALRHFVGMALIGLGLAAIDGRPARAMGRRLALLTSGR